MRVNDYRELEVYKKVFELQEKIFEFTKPFPRDEQYSLTDQVRRSSRSIGANLAEAWKKRRYVAHFTSKLTDADGEQSETIHWLDTAKSCGYLSHEVQADLVGRCEEIGRMLGTIIRDASQWCSR